LSVQAERDKDSGLYVADRYFESTGNVVSHNVIRALFDICIPAVILLGILTLTVTGFDVPVDWWFYPALLAECSAAVLVCRNAWCRRHRLVSGVTACIIWLAAAWICQGRFISGAREMAALISATLNRNYSGENVSIAAGDVVDAQIFLIFVSALMAAWLGTAMFQVHQMLMVYILIFPVVVLLALSGAAGNTVGLFMLLVGTLLCMVFMGTKRQFRMWGGARKALRIRNEARYEYVQKMSVFIMLLVGCVMFVPGYFLVRPMLYLSLQPLEKVSVRVQSSFLSKAVKILPDLSAGKWNLKVESVGGGVDEGSLDNEDGYLIDNVEDIRVTVDSKPEETIYLKGFVGSIYEDGGWKNSYETTFDAAAMNWNTDGSPRLYVQNLPFLRTSYALSQTGSTDPDMAKALGGLTASPVSMQVERLNANDKYTYVPYGVYLNDYYTVNAGDGYIDGQDGADDKYLFYSRKDMDSVLSAWNSIDDTSNVMDRVEESYRAYCEVNCLDIPDLGLDQIRTETEDSASDNHWKGQADIDDISSWIRGFLEENYSYEKNPQSAPDGEDELAYFLLDSRKGNSVQFASAAVVLYRMFGIPARYVVGYELPAGMFTAQPDGTYNVTADGGSSQAWAEIYVNGIGWVPEDMTPGIVGTYDETGAGGELIEDNPVYNKETDSVDTSEDGNTDSMPAHMRNISVGQIVMYVGWILVILIVISLCMWLVVRLCTDFGYTFAGRRDNRQRLIGVFRALYRRMCRCGLPFGTGSQDAEFLTFCENEIAMRDPERAYLVSDSVDRLYRVCYGGEDASEDDIRNMRILLRISYKRRKRS